MLRSLIVVPRAALVVAFMGVAAACAAGPPPHTPAAPEFESEEPVDIGWIQTGTASWYGEPFHGRRTASGEVYDMDGLTAAHQTLPFGTVIRVENRDNGRSVELRVTDRGPFARGRILDVSREGARRLGMLGPGTARVRLVVVRPGGDLVAVRGGCVVVQVAAYEDRATAEDRVARLARAGFEAALERYGRWHRVVVGPYDSTEAAARARDELDGFVRRCADCGM